MARFSAVVMLSASVLAALTHQAVAIDASPSRVVEVESLAKDRRLILADGRRLCLAGIWVPTPAASEDGSGVWRSAWRDIVMNGHFVHSPATPLTGDRYGCPLATPSNQDGVSLQQALLEAGWAAVEPSSMPGDDDTIAGMLALEDAARRQRRGIWRDPATWPKPVEELSSWIGTRQIVEGRVRRVSDNDHYVYVNFGADWRTDFTLRIRKKTIESTGFDAAALAGRRLRVRGVLQESRGPLVDVTHLQQIEFLP